MKLNMLGSGGVIGLPRPTCFCAVCKEARLKGIPYARTGSSLFVEDSEVLFDMPQESREQMNREKIKRIKAVILTHWHPDHTMGIRTLEELNWNYDGRKSFGPEIPVYISKQQYIWFKKYSAGSFLDYYQKMGITKTIFLENGQPIQFGSINITPFLIEYTKGFYFVINDGLRKVVYLPCEYHKVSIAKEIKDVDVFISHCLFWKNPRVSPRKNPPIEEDTFEKMLEDAKQMQAKKIYLMHIEESYKLGHDKLNKQLKKYYPGVNVKAGYDGLRIEL